MTQTTALMLTLLIEVPIVVGVAWACGWVRQRMGWLAAAAVGATLVTHPLLWLAQGALGGMTGLVIAEVVVALVEAAALAWGAGVGVRRGVVLSLLANGASFGTGLLIAW